MFVGRRGGKLGGGLEVLISSTGGSYCVFPLVRLSAGRLPMWFETEDPNTGTVADCVRSNFRVGSGGGGRLPDDGGGVVLPSSLGVFPG